MAVGLATALSSAQATPSSEDAAAVANAIDSFSNRLSSAADGLGNFGDLANNLPLTDLAPGSPSALDLSNLLKDKLGTLAGSYTSMADLATVIEGKDDTSGPLKIQFGAGTLKPAQVAVSSTDSSITIPIHAERHVDQPLEFKFGPVDMAGGKLGVDFVLDTTITFHVDSTAITSAATAPPTALSVDAPTIDLCANATGSVAAFKAQFGFTDVIVSTDNPQTTGTTENGTLHACAEVVFQDPDSTGGITLDEWTSHALSELVQSADIVDGDPGNDLDVTLYADATLVNGDAFGDATGATAPDASIHFSDANLSDGFNETPSPSVSPGLQAWLNITAGDVANGLQQFVAGLAGTQNLGGGKLPLLDKSITDIFNSKGFSAFKPLTDYVQRLTNATVVCGTTPGDATHFPSGSTDNLTTGTYVYCRAATQLKKEPGSVTWVNSEVPALVDDACAAAPPNPACGPTSGAAADATLGAEGAFPTADAVFKMKAPGNFAIKLTWDADPTGGVDGKAAIPRPNSAQQLFDRLASAAGIDGNVANLGYDAATKSLTFRLHHDAFDSPTIDIGADIGDLLRNETSLAGLTDASAGFSAGVTGIQFDVTFGVSLVDSTSDITPLRGTATGGSTGATLEDLSADFTDGDNDPRLGQVVKKTNPDPDQECTITAISQHTLSCSIPSGAWASGDTYDVDGGLADRFYIKTDPSNPEFSVDDIDVTGSASLKGTVGFLEVTAGINTGDGSFGISKADSNAPVLAIDIKAPSSNAYTIGGTTIQDAIGVTDLLFHLDSDHVGAVCNLQANADLGIAATVDGKELASGGVTVSWPDAFKPDSCEPDLSNLDINADTDFDTSLRNFDPFPSVSGTHDGGNSPNLIDSTKNFKNVGFDPNGSASPEGGNNLLSLTLKNKTTGASCTITGVHDDQLDCDLSGGTRSGDDADKNTWLDGDEYEVAGNALAFLSYILDNLDTLVDQVDKISPGLTDKELPLVGISTKDLVAKIKSIKQTTDELRGAPLAQIDCTANADGTNPTGFDLSQVPDGTHLYCRAVTTVIPTAVEWSEFKGTVNIIGPVKSDGSAGDVLHTVGSSPTDREEISVSDGDSTLGNDTAISEWQVDVKFTNAAGDHHAEFPTAGAPRSLQELGDMLSQKIGVDHIIQFELLDLPKAGDPAKTSGQADAGSTADNVLTDSVDFTALPDAEKPVVGNLLINGTDNHYCTITVVAQHELTCATGSGMEWSVNDDYQVVGDGTKDLVVRLGLNFCGVAGSITCDPDTDQIGDPISAPLNFKNNFADVVGVETNGTINLGYKLSAHLDIGIPVKLDLTPDIVVLDTSGASLEGSLDASDIGLSAAIGPLSIDVGTTATGGVGIGKLGARLSLESDTDPVPDNSTTTFTDFLSNVASNASFDGVNQECDDPATGNPVDASGDACAVLSMSALGQDFGNITVQCTIGNDPLCDATLPQALKDLINGQGLDWTLLIKVLPQILANLQKTLDGAAQDIHIPVIGDALDAGANVVGTFNNNIVTPFSNLVTDLQNATDQDGDNDVDAYDLAKLAQDFVWTNIGPASSVPLILDSNGDGTVTKDDVVVTPLCGDPADVCGNGEGVPPSSNLIRDFRITFLMGQAIDGDLPFDVGLKGLPLRLQGGVHGAGSWSLLVDFGLSLKDGPYIVAKGKKGFTGTDTGDAGPRKYLEDSGKNFVNDVELGMWLQNTTTNQGCRITKIETTKLWCDDYGTGSGVEGVDWHGGDNYELIARHAPDTPGTDTAAELNLNASVSMSSVADACTGDATTGLPGYLDGYDSDRCLKGQIAFLQVIVRDKNTSLAGGCNSLDDTGPTALMLCASLDFKSSNTRVTLSDLVAGNFSFDPNLSGKANINVRIRTGLNTGQSAGFPSVLGIFQLHTGFSVSPSTGVDFDDLNIHFGGLTLDAGAFITQFLKPIIQQVKDLTNPLMPVVEMLQGEVPIISDLSKLVGQGPVTVLDLLEAISGNDLSMMRSILQMIKFVNSLPTDGNLLIPLGDPGDPGSFDVSEQQATSSPLLPDSPEQPFENANAGTDLINDLGDSSGPYPDAKKAPAECDRASTFGVCGLSFPFLGNATQIFGVLMGKDATLVEYDAGTFGAGAGFDFCFPPILIGPVPVQICMGGSFRVDGRFAMGYDTSGLRKVLAGGTGSHLLDGIFLDDYDSKGVDVPEVKFTGTVYAEGAVSVYIFKVGIRGEIIFTAGLNLHEDPPQDGKLRIEEIVAHIFNPLCLFDVEGKIEASLSAFVKIDFFITSVEYSIQIVKVTLLEFNLDICNVTPVLAHNETDGSVEKLVLNMGSSTLRTKRGIAAGEINEKFTVRQMEAISGGPNDGKTRFSVTAFGIQQDYFLPTAKVGTENALLIADASDGDDVVSLLAGSASGEQAQPDQQKPPIPFTLRAQVSGGDDNDEITTGEGIDTVNGNGGDDKLTTGGSADSVSGGDGNDQIDAGTGDDTDVHGNGGNDIVNGGPGGDHLFGDGEDDVISSGPGEDANSPAVDELHGGPGNDTLNGDGGGDKLWGDEDLNFDCSQDGSTDSGTGNGNDQLAGGSGNDQMHGGNGNDTLNGFDGNDTMCGGGGADEMDGAGGKDTMSGNSGNDDMIGGGDDGTGDVMHGGDDRDYMIGDEGTLTRDGSDNVTAAPTAGSGGTDDMHGDAGRDFMWGQGANDTMNGDDGNDQMLGGAGDDTMNGNANDDEMYGDDTGDTSQVGVDTMHGNSGNDYMRGGPGTDAMDGDDGNDEMYGDGEVDTMRGGANDDLMRGGGGDDKMEGNGNDSSALPLNDSANPLSNDNFDLHLVKNGSTGAQTKTGGDDGDVMYGDAGQDDIVGGSQGGSPSADSGDTILGNTEQDVIVGDNGTITRPGGNDPDGTTTRSVTLNDPGGAGIAQADGDWIQGNLENDDIYAGGGGDLVHGNEGDDYVEGNGGSDGAGVLGGTPVAAVGLYGDAGQDDLTGGTSQNSGGVADGADDIWGGFGHDVIAGDNATITRAAGSDCPAEPDASAGYDCNTFRNAVPAVQKVVIRRIKIWDVATTGFTPVAGTSGNDTVNGEDGHDRIYGGGGGDNLKGGVNDDFVFGNAGADTIFGGDNQDDLIGGTGRTDSATPSTATDGRLDDGDLIYGEADFDAIAGDNSRMVRKTDGADDDHGLWVANTFNAAVDRLIALMDVGTTTTAAGAGTSGDDRLLGGAADDVIYGQGGNDGISGGADQDIIEGNANGTNNAPNPDPTAYPDWPAFAGDVIHGDAGADDIAGGTGWIYRMVAGVETGDPIVSSVRVGMDGRLDGADTVFGDGGADAIAGDNTVIERALSSGAWILDDLHSPDALDVVRRIMRERDVAITTNAAPLTDGTSGGDVIYGNEGVDVAYGQGGDDNIQGNSEDDHLEGNAGADTISGDEGRDDLIGGTGRTFSNDETTAADGRIDNQTGQDTLNGGDGAGGVSSNDDDVALGDNGTIDRLLGTLPAAGNPELGRLPFNGVWQETTWDAPNVLRVVRLLDVARSDAATPDTNGTNGGDTIRGEVGNDVLFGEGGGDTITASVGEDYIEGNGGADNITAGLGQDDIAGGGSARTGVLDANRDGRFDDNRTGENLTDGNDTIVGDEGDPAVGDGDVVTGDNARIQRLLASGAWRTDVQRGTRLRDVFLFDIRIVTAGEPGNADPSESGHDTISGNGGNDILLGQDNGAQYNGTFDSSSAPFVSDAFAREQGDALDPTHPPNCQDATGGPGSGTLSGTEEEPNGDNDNDDLPDLNDPQCRTTNPTGDTVNGDDGQDYIEGDSGSDNLSGGAAEDDVVGGSSANTGHLNVILPPADRDPGFDPALPPPYGTGGILEANKPTNLNDGHDVIEGNGEDDTIVGDNAFVDRYLGADGAWITVTSAGHPAEDAKPNPNPHPAAGPWEAANLVRRSVTMKSAPIELGGAFGNDYIRGGDGMDDIYGQLGNDWIEGNADEDAIVADLGVIVDNGLGPGGDELADPSVLDEFISPQQPFLGEFRNHPGILKREVRLLAFDITKSNVGVGHDVVLGGPNNDWIHTGPGEDLANGDAGDDFVFMGDNATAITAAKDPTTSKLAHDMVDAAWGGDGHDHLWGGYGADYLDVRPRSTDTAPGIFPTGDPETWFQIAGEEASQDGVEYQGNTNFEGIDYIYGGWDQDTLQANEGDNGPVIGDRLLDWSGSFNGYYLCPSTYGDWVSTRAIAPGLIEFLQEMAAGDGAGIGAAQTESATAGTSAFRETAIVFPNEVKFNTKPIHADTPAHFTCGPGTGTAATVATTTSTATTETATTATATTDTETTSTATTETTTTPTTTNP